MLTSLCTFLGSIVSVAGGSGSGKSTLANLLVRYYDPQSGKLLYGDENIRDYTPESWRDRIAIVPQDPALFSVTIAENSEFFFAFLHLSLLAPQFFGLWSIDFF